MNTYNTHIKSHRPTIGVCGQVDVSGVFSALSFRGMKARGVSQSQSIGLEFMRSWVLSQTLETKPVTSVTVGRVLLRKCRRDTHLSDGLVTVVV